MDQYDTNRQFLALFTENQKRIFAYILSLVPQRFDAEDIMQQTVFEMWKKFDQYKPGTNFTAWGITFAKFLILKHRERQHRLSILSPEVFDLIVKGNDRLVERSEGRTQALQDCIGRLGPAESRLIRLRYEEGCRVDEVAVNLGQTVNVVYKALAKIHTLLQLCVRRTLTEGGGL